MLVTLMMKQECIIKPYLGKTPKGDLYGEQVNSKCRLEGKQETKKDSNGREYISNAILYLPPTDFNRELPRASQVIFGSKIYIVDRVELIFGFKLSHIECVLI